jgi:hypothetical protein
MNFEFEGFQQFHDFLTTDGKELKGDRVNEFKRHVSNINRGCKCKKKARVSKAVQAYTRLIHTLDYDNRLSLKSTLGAEWVLFFLNGDLVKQV